MVAEIVVLTGTVEIVNVALVDPAGTVILAGTVAGLPPDNTTTAPPAGAAALRVAVPVTGFPPTTLDELNAIAERVTAAGVVVAGGVGELELHRIMATAATTIAASLTNGVPRRLTFMKSSQALRGAFRMRILIGGVQTNITSR
jgi:hypothetical protein